jgi:hypothetical protein
MTGRRPLGELVTELAEGMADLDVAGGVPVRARSLSLSVPVDLRVTSTDAGIVVIADVPLFLTRTAFDPEPARLEVDWHAVPPAPESAS